MRASVRRPREKENKVIDIVVHGSNLRSLLRLPCYSVAAPHFPIWGRWGNAFPNGENGEPRKIFPKGGNGDMSVTMEVTGQDR